MKNFKLKIVTPKGIYREVEIEMLNIRTTDGQIGILANHMPLASGIQISQMNYIINGKREKFAIAGGFVYVSETETTIIANAIESEEEIDIQRAMAAKQKAEKRIMDVTDIDMLRAEAALQRAITRINVKDM